MNQPNQAPRPSSEPSTGSALQAGRGEIRTPVPNLAANKQQQIQTQEKSKEQPGVSPKPDADQKETPAQKK